MARNSGPYIPNPHYGKAQNNAAKPDEEELHREAVENHEWRRGDKKLAWLKNLSGELRIRVSYNDENLWPFATLAALKAERMDGQSIVSKAAVRQWTLDAEQRLEFAEAGIHSVDSNGNCSCGLSVEVTQADGEAAPYETTRAIVLNTPGHFDHRTRTITSIFIAGRVGASQGGGFWIRPPGPLVEARWHCVYCGDLGEGKRQATDNRCFKPYKNFESHEENFASRSVRKSRWRALKRAELDFWLARNKDSNPTSPTTGSADE